MSKLAELAGAVQLRGKVCVTDVCGVTHEYENEDAAAAEWDSKAASLTHRRGAFYEGAPRAKAPEPELAVEAAPPPPPPPEIAVEGEEPKPKKKRRRR